MSRAVIGRDELRQIIEQCLPTDCAESTKAKLRAVGETTDGVAVGWFHCDGVACPARQAGRHNQTFQENFDRAMAARFGRPWDEVTEHHPVDPFVVIVALEPKAAGPLAVGEAGGHNQNDVTLIPGDSCCSR